MGGGRSALKEQAKVALFPSASSRLRGPVRRTGARLTWRLRLAFRVPARFAASQLYAPASPSSADSTTSFTPSPLISTIIATPS